MNEEEKKAIEHIRDIQAWYRANSPLTDIEYFDIVLNLIDKQQKEIEELKETVEFVNSHYISKDKISELVAKHKLEYEEQWCSYGNYYKFAKDVKELLEE